MRVGRRFKSIGTRVVISGLPVDWCDELGYLGMIFKSSTVFMCNLHENKANNFRAANSILRQVGSKNIAVLMSLVYAKCMPMLTYAVSAMMLKMYESSVQNLIIA